MPRYTQPHTESQQNAGFAQADVNPDDLQQTAGVNDPSYDNREGAQTAGTRSPRRSPSSTGQHNVEEQAVAHEGTLTSRTSDDATRQGISNRSAQSEKPGQEKVVSQRQDSLAGINHSGKTPPKA